MTPDTASVLLRACSCLALFQCAGVAVFSAWFGPWLQHSSTLLRRGGLACTGLAAVLTCLHYLLEAGRLGGDWASLFDGELQLLVWQGAQRSAWLVRMAALLPIAAALASAGKPAAVLGLSGAVLLAMSFTLVGHTREAELAWLGWLLAAHVVMVICWFGSLLPMRMALRAEPLSQAAHILHAFSRWAVWMVALLLLAGSALLALLLPGWAALLEPYGLLLLMKLAVFALLLGLAALNKWRYLPRLAREAAAQQALRRMILAEYWLIAAVVALTALLTSFYSP